jgi:hypothetical protein
MLEDRQATIYGSKLRRLASVCMGLGDAATVLVLSEFDVMTRQVGQALASYGVPCTVFVGTDRNKYAAAKKMQGSAGGVFVGSTKHFLGFTAEPDHVVFLHPIIKAHEKIPGMWPALTACLGNAVIAWHYMCTTGTVDDDMYKDILNYESVEVDKDPNNP